MSFVDSPFCFGFRKRLNMRGAVEVSRVHNVNCVGIRYDEDRDQNMDDEIHRRDIIVVNDDAIERLLFGAALFFFDLFRSRIRSKIHGRDYKLETE
jgi:hypothetical protein